MKILVSGCYFTPDPIGGGKFTGEMAEWLVTRGHEVRAVTAPPFIRSGGSAKVIPAGAIKAKQSAA